MSALQINFQHFFPWVSFLAGLGGSLHCVGMCGGLVTASCDRNKDVVKYQLGRLLGYLILGLVAGYVGGFLKFEQSSPLIAVIPGTIIGLLFLYWGIQNWKGKKAELPMPRMMGKFYSFLWKKLVFKNLTFSKAFFTGLISIFLPCGLLYGVVLGGMAMQNPLVAMSSMLFFWIGTIPSMVLAPSIFQKILSPFKSSLPRTYAASLIILGLMTVSFRVVKFNQLTAASKNAGAEEVHHSCH